MIARMIVTSFFALSLSSILPIYSTGRISPSSHIQQPQSAHSSKTLRILIEEDFSTAQALKKELSDWSHRMGLPIIFAEKATEPYDLRILLASGLGRDSGSCSTSYDASCTPSSSSCRVTLTIYFVSAVALAPDGALQFTETGAGSSKRYAVTPLARKLAKRLLVLPGAKVTPSK